MPYSQRFVDPDVLDYSLPRAGVPRTDLLDVNNVVIDAILDWPRQKADFERDGMLRDIYVEDATAADWTRVVAYILGGDHGARLECGGAVVAMPADVETAFAENARYALTFMVGGVEVVCHFFSLNEIELSFEPQHVSETELRALLSFMIELGEITRKPVLMTLENAPRLPIFRYDARDLRWMPAPRR